MRAALFLLSLLIALGGGIYLSRYINPVWLSSDMHRPLDEIAEEIISNSQFGPSIERTLEGSRIYYQNYAKNLDLKQKARILALLEENEDSLRKEMRSQMKQLLIQSLSREEMIEIKNFYRTRAGQQFSRLVNSQKEHAIYGTAFSWSSNQLAQITASPSAPKATPDPASIKQSK
jgi:hypothetical protein